MADSPSLWSRAGRGHQKLKNFKEFSEVATMRSRKAAVSSRFSRYPDAPTPRRQYKDREHPAELYTIDENPELITDVAPLIILERKIDASTEPQLELLALHVPKMVASSGEGEFPSPEQQPSMEVCSAEDSSSSDMLIVKIQESSDDVASENDGSDHKFISPNVTRSVEAACEDQLEHNSCSNHVLKGTQSQQSSHELLEKVSSTYVLRLEQSVQRTKTELQESIGEDGLQFLESKSPAHEELDALLNLDPTEPPIDGSETSELEEQANNDDHDSYDS